MILETQTLLPMWWLTVVLPLGLASAWLARVHEGSRRQSASQWMFLVLLALVGATTLGAAITTPAWCLVCGTTLAVMVLAAVWDFSSGRKAAVR